jgi:hypothetical protein
MSLHREPERQKINLALAANTSPCVVSVFGSIYLFFNSDSNNNIFFCTSEDGKQWTAISSVNEELGSNVPSTAHTSPSATVHDKKLHLFWNKATPVNALQYATMSSWAPGKFKWEGPTDVTPFSLALVPKTSSAAVDFDGKLYLFYNGVGGEGTFMTTLSSNEWSSVRKLPPAVRLISSTDKSSPAPFVSDSGRELSVMWNGTGNSGIFSTSTLDGSDWKKPTVSLSQAIPGQKLAPNTSPCGVSYKGRTFVFWIGASDMSLYFSERIGTGDTIDVNEGDFLGAQQALLAGRDFTMVSADDATILFFQSRFGSDAETLDRPVSKNYASVFKQLLGNDPGLVPGVVAGIITVVVAGLLKGYRIEFRVNSAGGCRVRCRGPVTNGT